MRRPFAVFALAALAAGLALHNVAMAGLWDAGVRGGALDVVAAWKEALLAVALGVVLWRTRRLPAVAAADVAAAVYTAVVLVYAVLPQDWLGGEATTRGVLLALRHHLVPVAAYALGRLAAPALRRHGEEVLAVAAAVAVGVAVWGLVDVYAVPLQWWRASGVPGWYEEQLGLAYRGLSGLPENWVFNASEEEPVRRLVSTLLSPLAAAYLLVVVLLHLAARRPTPLTLAAAAVASAGLLFTHTRAAFLVLAGGLVVLALVRRRWWPALLAAGSIAVGVAFVQAFPAIGPVTTYTPSELAYLRAQGAGDPEASGDALSGDEPSLRSHLSNLRDGLETVLRHPQGHGLGNAGVVAKRTGVEIRAGESTYTELGAETGVLGASAFVAWSLLVLRGLWRREAWLAAAFAAVLALALQTDVLGVHWLAYVVWALVGAHVADPAGGRPPGPRGREDAE